MKNRIHRGRGFGRSSARSRLAEPVQEHDGRAATRFQGRTRLQFKEIRQTLGEGVALAAVPGPAAAPGAPAGEGSARALEVFCNLLLPDLNAPLILGRRLDRHVEDAASWHRCPVTPPHTQRAVLRYESARHSRFAQPAAPMTYAATVCVAD
jgi:hypothetical protein